MKHGKKYLEAAKAVDRSIQYDPADAISTVKKLATAKFDAKIDKNTNRKQIFLHFFSFYLKHRAKNYPNMK